MGPEALILFASMAAAAPPVPEFIVQSIAEVRAESVAGDAVWPGYSTAPFGFILVGDTGEVLLCDDRLPEGFTKTDPLPGLDCPVATGPSTWRKPFLLASMPVFGPGEVIAMGSPEATQLAPMDWRQTILHEHFHQWQGALPDVQARVDALNLTGGDETGMWMLNYPFPYDRPAVALSYRRSAEALLRALSAPDRDVERATNSYLKARKAFAGSVTPEQWRYFDFQLWKEGVARWSETEIARRYGDQWAQHADQSWARTLADLGGSDLSKEQRVAVYAYGAAEAALLQRVRPGWRDCYRQTVILGDCWGKSAAIN